MKIVDYVILSGNKRVDLTQQVKSYILDGRQPFGGLSEDDHFLHQAMVKYEETKTEHKENSIIEILYHQRGVLIDGFHKIQSKKMLEELVLNKQMKETIEIAGIKFLKQRLQAEPNNVDIFERDGEYYFTRESAMREAKAQGLSLLSPEQFETMAKSFDGYKEGERCKAYKTLADALGLKLSGYRNSDGEWNNKDNNGYSWSSVEKTFFTFNEGKGKLTTNHPALSFPVVVCQDSTIGKFDNSENKSELKKIDKPTIKKRLKDKDISAISAYDIAEFVRDFNLL